MEAMKFRCVSEEWGDPVLATFAEWNLQAEIFKTSVYLSTSYDYMGIDVIRETGTDKIIGVRE